MSETPKKDQTLHRLLADLQTLRHYDGTPEKFWQTYLGTLVRYCEVDYGIIISSSPNSDEWKKLITVKSSNDSEEVLTDLYSEIADQCLENGSATLSEDGYSLTAITLKIQSNEQQLIAIFGYKNGISKKISGKLSALQFVNDLPAAYQSTSTLKRSGTNHEYLTGVLDLLSLIYNQDRFLSASMTLCNELFTRHNCDRVSIGWLKRGYVRLQAMSNVDTFDKKMEAVQKLEQAMEESLDQGSEIIFPAPAEQKAITKDHETYARIENSDYLCSVPITVNDKIVAVCTLERKEKPFTTKEASLLRLACDHCGKRLSDLKESDKWFGALFAGMLYKQAGKLIGYEHTWGKLIAISLTVILAILLFVPVTYRVQAPVILKTDNVAYLTAPFDGHIDDVHIKVGEKIAKDSAMLHLDKTDLLLNEAALEAEMRRYRSEIEKAFAENALAEMKIAEALMQQSESKLQLIKHKLGQATIYAPFDGVLVEGDQMERVGSPVSKGDVLFKIAQVNDMYCKIKVNEKDIHFMKDALKGEIALASRPEENYNIQVTRIEPSAVAEKDGNIFFVHGKFAKNPPTWWRPGMTGIAKLNTEKKTLLWIFTHKTIDFLRLKLWW